MEGLINFVQDIYNNCHIAFNIYLNDKLIFQSKELKNKSEDIIENRFTIGKNIVIIETEREHKDLLKLVEYCIKNKYKENYNKNEKTILKLLNKEPISDESKNELPFNEKNLYLICINVPQNSHEVVEILKNIYSDTENIIVRYNEYVVLIGDFEDIEDHVLSISDTINTSLYTRSYICYSMVENYEELSHVYEKCTIKIHIGKRYKVSETIYNDNALIFERILEDINDKTKKELDGNFRNFFSSMDEDMIKTIETFFKLDLNLSEASKQLYVHRNTLIYRLEKIQKYTGYDIRKFSDACVFKIVFTLYNQKRNK